MTLGTLQAYSLVQENIGGGHKTFSLHRLVSMSTQRWLEQTPNGKLEWWHSEAITVLSETVPSDEYENWRRWGELLPHTQVALGYLWDSSGETDALRCALILTNAAWYELRMGRHESAHRKGRRALDIRQRFLGETHEDTLFTKSLLALTFGYQNLIGDAIGLNEEALVARTMTLGSGHRQTVMALSNLADAEAHTATQLCKASLVLVLRNTGKKQEAGAMYSEVLRDYLDRDPSATESDVAGLENLIERLAVMKD